MAAEAQKEHQLTLKVMRLTKPSFSSLTSMQWLNAKNSGEHCEESGFHPFLLSESLLLPQSIENIYLGETFSCYICLHNDGSTAVTEICLKVDLQTSSQRISLSNQYQNGVAELAPGSTLGDVVNHEVKELGQHILVCAVTYAKQSGEKAYFRKFFKFPVSKPLDVKTKFYNAESDEVYLEAQIQNLCHLPMVLDRVALEPSELYSAEELIMHTKRSDSCILNYLNPTDIRQYLYRLIPYKHHPLKSYRGMTQVGKIDMVWYTTNGERGRLQTSQLQRVVPGSGDLRIIVEDAPSSVKIGEDFSIRVCLHNCVERTLDLIVAVENSLNEGISWNESDDSTINHQITSESNVCITLKLKATKIGLHGISGIRVRDTLLERLYEYDEVAQVFVYS